jgi:hypothetical protein
MGTWESRTGKPANMREMLVSRRERPVNRLERLANMTGMLASTGERLGCTWAR